MDVEVREGYGTLADVLKVALEQAQNGKGSERHQVHEREFDQQPIMEIGRMVGPGYNVGQAMKKAQEAMRLPYPRNVSELLGAINYLASAVALMDEDNARPTQGRVALQVEEPEADLAPDVNSLPPYRPSRHKGVVG